MLDSVSRLQRMEQQANRIERALTRARTPKRTPSTKRATHLRFGRYRDDPVGFFRDVLGIELWKRQAEVARAAAKFLRVACRSGHKVGKSTLAAGLALWWVTTRERGRVILTSSGKRQVKSILWKELRKLYREARTPIGGTLFLDPGTGLQFPDGREVLGFTTDDAEKMAGFSGEELLFVIDEASGFPDEIYEAVEGNTAGGATTLLFGNPTRVTGFFFEAFHRHAGLWDTHHISSTESPNVTDGASTIPGLAGPEWLAMMRQKYGPDPESNPNYRVRVEGNFPGQQANGVIGSTRSGAARKRWPATKGEGTLEIGVDVARFGDDESVVQPRRGKKAYPSKVVNSMDGWQVGGLVLAAVIEHRDGNERAVVKVDGIGVGASVVDFLRRDKRAQQLVYVVDINVGMKATNEEDYVNLRSQLWFGVAGWLEDGALPEDRDRDAELLAATYRTDARNRLAVCSKDDLKRELKRSPDRADALALAVHHVNAHPSVETLGDSITGGLRKH